MKCPHCDATLVMSERQGIEIDYCPECRGVWLDRGELDKIIERASATSTHSAVRESPGMRPEHRHREESHYRKKKHKSFLGDLFDF